MKLLITVKSLTDGGAERVAALWANGLVACGHEVLIANNTNRKCSYILDKKIKTYNLHSEIKNNILSHISYITNLRRLIKKSNPDVIINILNPGAIYDYLATIGLNIPIINTEHNAFERPQNAPLTRIESFCKFYFNSFLTRVTVLTQADKDVIGNRLKNVVVLPNPCTFETVKNIPGKEKTILAVGRLDAWKVKGFDVLIEAWGKISSLYPEWTLKIVGSSFNNSKKYLSNLADKHKISNTVRFIDYNPDIISEYKKSAIFVLSSRYEGFGMVLLEAMSQGCACIACDYKGRQREILGESQYGLICNTNDANMLADKISSLISDENLRIKFQHKAIQRAKDYSIDTVMDKWNSILQTI